MKDFYKPLLGDRLEFPADWGGVVVSIQSGFTGYLKTSECGGVDILGPSDMYFATWADLLAALRGPQRNNRQLHVIADLISWDLRGPGVGGPLKAENQIELPF